MNPAPKQGSAPKQGGEFRLDELFRHKEWVNRLARGLVNDPSRADDIVQQVWMAAIRYRPKQDRDLRPWLATVARDAARKLGRSEARLSRREKRAAKGEALAADSALFEKEETRKKIAEMVRDMEEPYRSTVIMHFFEELTSEEIARRLGIPGPTVRTRLRRALDKLRVRLESRYGSSGQWIVFVAPLAVETRFAPTGLQIGAGKAAVPAAGKISLLQGTLVSVKAAMVAAVLIVPPIAVWGVRSDSAAPQGEMQSAAAPAPPPPPEIENSVETSPERYPADSSEKAEPAHEPKIVKVGKPGNPGADTTGVAVKSVKRAPPKLLATPVRQEDPLSQKPDADDPNSDD